MVFSFLRSKKPVTSYLKPAFSAPVLLKCAWLKRPSGGCAGAGTHLYRDAGGGTGLDWPGAQPVPRPAPGAVEGVPWPRFSWIYTYAESGWNVPRKAGKRAAHSREAGAKGGRPKKAAAADAVLSMPCCSSPLPSPVHKGRSSPDEARRRSSRQIGFASTTPALFFSSANARTTGRPPRAFLLSSLTSLFMQQAEQDLTIFIAMPFA